MTSAAAGSAHHRPSKAFSSNPPRRIADKYMQKSVCFASACIAALPSNVPTLRLARASNGITTSDTHARTMPGMLCAEASCCIKSRIDSYAMYAASARKPRPTVRNASRSFRSRRSTSASTLMRHSNAAPEVTSMKLSTPNPTREMLPATAPATIATTPSRLFHPMVKYSSLRPRRATATRSITKSSIRWFCLSLLGSIPLARLCGPSSEL